MRGTRAHGTARGDDIFRALPHSFLNIIPQTFRPPKYIYGLYLCRILKGYDRFEQFSVFRFIRKRNNFDHRPFVVTGQLSRFRALHGDRDIFAGKLGYGAVLLYDRQRIGLRDVARRKAYLTIPICSLTKKRCCSIRRTRRFPKNFLTISPRLSAAVRSIIS